MKLITFDGFQAAGKSTYARKLANYFGREYPFHYYTYDDLALEGAYNRLFQSSDHPVLPLLPAITAMKRAQVNQWKDQKLIVLDEFWKTFFQGTLEPNDAILGAFQTFIEHDGGYMPTASFYIRIPFKEAIVRYAKRELAERLSPEALSVPAKKMEYCERVKISGVKADRSLCEKKDNYQDRISKWLAARLDYFYIIDGTQPPDVIFSKILGILQTKGVRN